MRTALWPDSTENEVDGILSVPRSEGIVLVAERAEGGLRGFAELASRKFADGCLTSPIAYLEGIWIDPDSRRTGIASAIVREGVTWARSLGLSELASDCDIDNEASHRFHLAAGFAEVKRSICFRRDLALPPNRGSA